MNNKEILDKAIQKAIDGGWKFPYAKEFLPIRLIKDRNYYSIHNGGSSNEDWDSVNIEAILFNQEFAKYIWANGTETGLETICDVCESFTKIWLPTWEYHLQQMVISEDPIAYLGANI